MLQALYDWLFRPYLPRKLAVFNTVAVRQPKLLDTTDLRPQYEWALVDAIERVVRPGDNVVVVGGGWGVSSVVAARRAGTDGFVITYEASKEHANHVRETALINGVDDRIEVRHTIVGKPRRVYGDYRTAASIGAKSLPDCDVLVLDCEGAERDILESITIRPRQIIVETHPMFESPTNRVTSMLNSAGFTVVNRQTMEVDPGVVDVIVAESTD